MTNQTTTNNTPASVTTDEKGIVITSITSAIFEMNQTLKIVIKNNLFFSLNAYPFDGEKDSFKQVDYRFSFVTKTDKAVELFGLHPNFRCTNPEQKFYELKLVGRDDVAE